MRALKTDEDFDQIESVVEYWQPQPAFAKKNKQYKRDLVNSLLLKGNLLAIYEYPEFAIEIFQEAITYEPTNLYALSMLLVQKNAAQDTQEEIEIHQKMLKDRAPDLYHKLHFLLTFIKKYSEYQHIPEIDSPLELICVCGYWLNPDGTISGQLEKRLRKTIELSMKYPKAKILVSGGSVYNKYVEAIEMRRELIRAGIEEERIVALQQARDTVGNIVEFSEYIQPRNFHSICVVTSLDHLPRSWMALYVALQKIGYDAQVVGAAVQENLDVEDLDREKQYSYQTVLRVAEFFTKQDIERQEKNLIESFDL